MLCCGRNLDIEYICFLESCWSTNLLCCPNLIRFRWVYYIGSYDDPFFFLSFKLKELEFDATSAHTYMASSSDLHQMV